MAVAAFLAGRIGFTQIASLVERTMDRLPAEPVGAAGLEHVLAVDARAREVAGQGLRALAA